MIPVRAWWIPALVVALVGCGSSTTETGGAVGPAPLGINEGTWPTSAASIERALDGLPRSLDGLSKGDIQFDYPPGPEPGEPGVADQEPRLLEVGYLDASGGETAEISAIHEEANTVHYLAESMVLVGCWPRSLDLEGSEVLAPVMAAQGFRKITRELRALEGSTHDELVWYSCTSTYDLWNDEKLPPDDYLYITSWASDGWVYAVTADRKALRDTLTRALVSSTQDSS